jgi:hypothetical protein
MLGLQAVFDQELSYLSKPVTVCLFEIVSTKGFTPQLD